MGAAAAATESPGLWGRLSAMIGKERVQTLQAKVGEAKEWATTQRQYVYRLFPHRNKQSERNLSTLLFFLVTQTNLSAFFLFSFPPFGLTQLLLIIKYPNRTFKMPSVDVQIDFLTPNLKRAQAIALEAWDRVPAHYKPVITHVGAGIGA